MTDPNDTELIRRVQTRCCADPACAPPGDAPLSPQAEERCREIQNVWLALGAWELPEQQRDLWPRIEAQVHRLEGRLDMSEYNRRTHTPGEVWGALDRWELSAEERDLWPRIEQAAREGSAPRRGRLSRWLRRVLRALASVLPGRRRS